jgi:hypothetical protein
MNVIPLSTYIEKVKNNGIITLGRITRKGTGIKIQ